MFKNIDYTGLKGQPELQHLAEQATTVLANLIRTWRDEVIVTWRSAPTGSDAVLELTLNLEMSNTVHSASGLLRRKDFANGKEERLRMSLRDVWLDLLDIMIDQLSANVEASFAESLEV